MRRALRLGSLRTLVHQLLQGGDGCSKVAFPDIEVSKQQDGFIEIRIQTHRSVQAKYGLSTVPVSQMRQGEPILNLGNTFVDGIDALEFSHRVRHLTLGQSANRPVMSKTQVECMPLHSGATRSAKPGNSNTKSWRKIGVVRQVAALEQLKRTWDFTLD
jgi:hypothetical protein